MVRSLISIVQAIVFLHLLKETQAWNKFCSVVCTDQSCASTNYADCTGACSSPWVWNATTNLCQIPTTSGWAFAEASSDTGVGTMSSDITTVGTCGPYTGGSLWTYSYLGNMTGAAVITFSDPAGVQLPHYQLRVIFWMIAIDNWSGQNIVATLQGNQTKTQPRSSKLTMEKTCGTNGDAEDYIRFDQIYTHNTSNPYTIAISTTSTNQKWGVKEVVVLAKLCNTSCTSCFGPAISQCYSCEQDTPMLLSGTTCNQTCLPGYGMMLDNMNCVFCDLKCLVCFELADNCSSCKPTGTYASFLYTVNSSCLIACPIGFYGNVTDRTCYPCDLSCISCKTLPTYCYQCNVALGYGWNNYFCYSPCPIGTFSDNSSANCTNCSPYCITCENTSTTCTSCTLTGTFTAYLLGTDCLRACPPQYYPDTAGGTVNTCQPCDISCYLCTANPTPCSQCNPNYWLYLDACGLTCPDQYFQDNVTWKCLLCSDFCVGLTMDMYFADATNGQIYVDMSFTEDLDFSTFPYETFQTFSIKSDLYTIEMFSFTYQIINARTYRIIVQPKGYIFLYNATIECTTMEMPSIIQRAQNGRPFKESNYLVSKDLVWFVIKAPDMTEGQKKIINGLSNMSDMIRDITTKPFIQELKKAGVFSMFFSGAQITSCSVLVNNIPSQNLYEGVRFWAIWVFFDVPKWQKNSDKTKYVVVPAVAQVVKDSRLLQQQQRRSLFDITSIEWRFARTGHTSFFIFDVYPVIAMILFCWILLAIGYCLNSKKPLLFKKHMGKFYTFLHKVHQVSIMYIMLSTILQWLYFDSNYLERWLSLAFCIIANIYFLGYELYIYYDMLKYPVAQIGNDKYEYYAIRYGSYLKNIRYQQYDLKDPWSPKQWFRPYNYHILAYYKKLMMIISLPIFYHSIHAQAAVLVLLQAAQIARFCVIWPFYKLWRNIFRLILQCALEMFFICVLIQGFLVHEIMLNNEETLMNSIQMFYRFGWVGFGMVFFFNCSFLVLYIYDFVRGCRMSNRKMMDQARRVYYYNKLKSYQQQNEDVPLGLVNKWVKLGNLNDRNYDTLPDVNIRVEYFRIAKLPNDSFEIEVKRLVDLFMNIEFNFSKDNNVNIGRKINKRFNLSRELSKNFYLIIDSLYRTHYSFNLEYIIIKTFQRVEQSLYKPGEMIELDRQKMSQKITLEMFTGQKKTIELEKVMNGFPVSVQDLNRVP